MDKFYVGAKVVCVKSHSDGASVKGKVYEVIGISKFNCSCKRLVLDLGITTTNVMVCDICSAPPIDTRGILWQCAERFRLLEPDIELSETYSDEILDLINANA